MNIYDKYSAEKWEDPSTRLLQDNLDKLEEDILQALGDYSKLLWNVGNDEDSKSIMTLYSIIGSLNPTNS